MPDTYASISVSVTVAPAFDSCIACNHSGHWENKFNSAQKELTPSQKLNRALRRFRNNIGATLLILRNFVIRPQSPIANKSGWRNPLVQLVGSTTADMAFC